MSSLKKLKPLNDRILFTFLQDTRGNQFRETTKFGLQIIEDKDKQMKTPRWGVVISVGEDVSSEITEGLYVLIDPLGWTLNVEFENEKFWNTSEERVIAVTTERPTGL